MYRRSPPKQKFGGAPHVLVPKNTFEDVFHNTCDIGDFRADILCPEKTQELPEKHHEAGPPKQLPTDALSKSVPDTLDTVKTAKRFTCAGEQRKGHFGKSE